MVRKTIARGAWVLGALVAALLVAVIGVGATPAWATNTDSSPATDAKSLAEALGTADAVTYDETTNTVNVNQAVQVDDTVYINLSSEMPLVLNIAKEATLTIKQGDDSMGAGLLIGGNGTMDITGEGTLVGGGTTSGNTQTGTTGGDWAAIEIGMGTGTLAGSPTVNISGVTVRNSDVGSDTTTSSISPAIAVNASSKLTVEDATIEGMATGIQAANGSDNGPTVTVTSGTVSSATTGAANKGGIWMNGGTLTLGAKGTEGPTVTGGGSTGQAITVTGGATVDMESGTVTGYDTGIYADNGTVNVKDGTVTGTGETSYGIVVSGSGENAGKVTISGGEVSGTTNGVGVSSNTAGGNPSVEITGGEVSSTSGAAVNNDGKGGKVTISGGTIDGAVDQTALATDGGSTEISGGTFSEPVDPTMLKNVDEMLVSSGGTYTYYNSEEPPAELPEGTKVQVSESGQSGTLSIVSIGFSNDAEEAEAQILAEAKSLNPNTEFKPDPCAPNTMWVFFYGSAGTYNAEFKNGQTSVWSSNTQSGEDSGLELSAPGFGVFYFTFTPNAGSSSTEEIASGIYTATVTMGESDQTVTASDTIAISQVTYESNGGELAVPNNNGFYFAQGQSVTLAGVKKANSLFTGWTVDGKVMQAGDTITVPMTGAQITATAGWATVSVAVSPALSGEAAVTYNADNTATLTATPADGMAFKGWAKDNGELASTKNPWTIEVGDAGSYIAVFEKAPDTSDTLISVYRLWNPVTGEHLISSDPEEYDWLVANTVWTGEGVMFLAPAKGPVEIHRMYNPNNGDHVYSSSKTEQAGLVAVGWKDEGTCFYAPRTSQVPVMRLYNPAMTANGGAGNHLWTTDLHEYAELPSLAPWRQEGVAWYAAALPQGSLD